VSAAVASLIALVTAIVLSIVTRMNVGLIAIALAWIVGVYGAGLTADTVVRGFPTPLFLTLAGVTLLFAAAETNGTLERLAHQAVRVARGNARVLPVLFFLIAFLITAVGPGSIAGVALVVPLAMAIGERAAVPHFLTALMVANGANAGNLSPISAVGVIANTKMAEAGLAGHQGKVFFANLAAHSLVAVAAYFFLRGWQLTGRTDAIAQDPAETTMTLPQKLTIAIVLAWIVSVLAFKVNVGLSAFTALALLVLARSVDDPAAFKRAPWGVIIMVCGVTVLLSVLEETGGMELFTRILANLATPATVNGVIAFVTGLISTYSSTSGVVLPAFLPTAPGLVQNLGGGDPLAVALSINIGSSLVDVSPLSTLGALCVASVPGGPVAASRLFRQLLAWGLSMAIVGGIIAQIFAGLLARL
jgi:di/tricarboxylate transporter